MIARLLNTLARRFPLREIVEDNTLYLERFCLLGDMQARHAWLPFSVYLHHFVRPDSDRALHNHPWPWAVSFVLSGGYLEARKATLLESVLSPLEELTHRAHGGVLQTRWLHAGAVNIIRGDTFHRVAELSSKAPTWTLFVVGRKEQAWGFDVPGQGFVPFWTRETQKARERGRNQRAEDLAALAVRTAVQL